MNSRTRRAGRIVFWLLAGWSLGSAQTLTYRGQFTGWVTGWPREGGVSHAGLRYLPEFTLDQNRARGLSASLEFAAIAEGTLEFSGSDPLVPAAEGKAYRLWGRLAGDRFEIRLGLQKINFGSATLFRPLRWFDRLDPRDPLQLTTGVKGLLLRYYFPDNTNIWFWGLLGNHDPKGWETLPTHRKALEFGGRLQLPVPAGEAGFTYHHRRADADGRAALPINENRFALDCKLDIAIGLWFEIAAIQRDTDLPLLRHQHMWTLGADYTFALGNGLRILAEFSQTARADRFFGMEEHAEFLGLSVHYPLSMLDQVTAIYYWDPGRSDHYLWLNWQRTTDHWQFHVALFFNPQNGGFNRSPAAAEAFTGNGFRVMVVFNH